MIKIILGISTARGFLQFRKFPHQLAHEERGKGRSEAKLEHFCAIVERGFKVFME